LIEWHPERFYDSVIGPDRRRALFEAVDLSGMNRRVDLGAPFRETVYETAAAHPEFSAEVRMWFDGWIKMASPEIPHSAKLLRALRKKDVPVFALSNFGVGSFEYAATVYPVFSEFDRRYISGYLEMMKPDPLSIRWSRMTAGWRPLACFLRTTGATISRLRKIEVGTRIYLKGRKVWQSGWLTKDC